MVRTRSKSLFIDRTTEDTAEVDVDKSLKKAIWKKASEMANSRLMNQTLSPSARSRRKYKRKAMRESIEKENLLASVKKNFTKAADRTLPDLINNPKLPFEQLLDEIRSGTAKEKLKPTCEAIPN